MAASSFWRGLAPVWLRVLAGLLIFPFLWVGFELLFAGLLARVLPDSLMVLLADNLVVLTVLVILVAGIIAILLVRKSSTRRAAALSSLAVLVYAMASLTMIGARLPRDTFDRMPAEPPQAESPGGEGAELPLQPMQPEAPGPDLGAPSGGGGLGSRPRALQPPKFPWPPPAASASYVLPDRLFSGHLTVGDATGAILSALEQNGYVERSFYRTEPGGVALVTRLERINDDGSPSAATERWPASAQRQASTSGLLDFLQGLFFVDPGHYRVIVFVLQDLPFTQSSEVITAEQAHAWLTSGTNVLPREIANLPFAGAHVTVLIYEFASDGSKVQVVTSQLTGKQHLEKAGVLAVLDPVQ